MTTRADWICYTCGGTSDVVKRRVRITTSTTECIFLCRDHIADAPNVINAMRRMLA